jgi:endonuclease III
VTRRTKAARRRALAARPRRIDAATRGKAIRTWERLKEAYPEAECALHHEGAFQLLVATILSAQCTDARVNVVTPALFAALGTPEAMAPLETIEEYVRSTGFFRNKAKSLKGMAQRLVDAYGGQVPRTMDELLTLPGVARKTANVVLGTAYGVAEGVVVDTHVHRLSHRLGWSNGKTPVHVERDLTALFPKDQWIELAHTLIHHGRRICLARRPKCPECPVKTLCPSSLA